MRLLPSLFLFATSLVVGACSSSSTDESVGTLALGASCQQDGECAQPSGRVVRCQCTSSGSSPKCTALLEPGDTCKLASSFSPSCREGVCTARSSSDDATCPVLVGIGEACGDGRSCREGACESGTCSAPKAVGEACLSDSECAAPATCPSDQHTCQSPRHEGQACELPLGKDREPCDPGLRCMTSGTGATCGTPRADGAPCSHPSECATRACRSSKCGRPSGDTKLICL